MKKQLILLLIASTVISNVDAAAQRFYNWCVNNRSRLGLLSGAALSSGAAAYYWKNRKLPIEERPNICGLIPQGVRPPNQYPIEQQDDLSERPHVIECPRVDFEGRPREIIQFCGDKPGEEPRKPIFNPYSIGLPKHKPTEHEKIREHLIREEKEAKEKRERYIEEILRQRSSSCDNCK